VCNTCRTTTGGPQGPTFTIYTQPNTIQQRALELLNTISV
jgi:hypothetical protein